MKLAELLIAAQNWLDQDPDPVTRAELRALMQKKDTAALRDRFESRLTFGTAGLRAELGAGPNRMNRLLVTQAAAGIANWLKKNSAAITPSVVIGYDARVNSRAFALDSAAVFSAAGIRALVFENEIPTPMLAYAVREFGFSLGIMVTASHNPPRDNGYKVYLGEANGGSQIVSPIDKQIAAEISKVAEKLRYDEIARAEVYQIGGQEVAQSYLATTASLATTPTGPALKVVYTAMHGVGWGTTKALFSKVGLPEPIGVSQQLEPNGVFPTVAFPNPEEPGALDLAFAKAVEANADLIIAHDPDADRLGVGIKSDVKKGEKPTWRRLTGDEVGLLLGHYLAEKAIAAGNKGTMATTIVSSSALSRVAAAHKLKYVETLTGFKYLARVPKLIFGYEEALGYSVNPSRVPDKDGISASMIFVCMATELAAQKISINQQLEMLREKYGHFATSQITVRVTKPTEATRLMVRLRSRPPKKLAGKAVLVTDLLLAKARLDRTDGLRFELEDGRRVIVRPSGTEPKLKCYLQAEGTSAESAKKNLAELTQAVNELLGI